MIKNHRSITQQFLKSFVDLWLVLGFAGGLLSCAKSKQEGELQSKISLTSTGPEYVLPNELVNVVNDSTPSASLYYTCAEVGSVSAPRIRIRKMTLNWSGTGKLLPLVIQIKSDDKQLSSEYTFTLSPSSTATLASLFGITATDYVPQGSSATYSTEDTGLPGTSKTSRCYVDLPNLPKPKTMPKGTTQVKIQAKIIMSSLVETVDESGSPVYTPVVKEIPFNFVYIDGSVIE